MAKPPSATEYLLPDDGDLRSTIAALSARLRLEQDPSHAVDRTYLDTFDGLLHERGLLLVLDAGRLVLLDAAGAERASADLPRRPRRLMAADLPDGPLRTELAAAIDVRAVTPIARTRGRVHPLRVLNRDAKTVVRLVVEEAAAVLTGGGRAPLRTRLRVVPVRGYDKPLARVHRALAGHLQLAEADESLVDEAVRAAGGVPGGVRISLDVGLTPDQRADGATVLLLMRLLDTVEANLPGTLADVDSEFLHDLRVAVRRSRSVERQLHGVFPPDAIEYFRAEFKWLQQITGPSRDLDVYTLEFEDFTKGLPEDVAPDLEPLRDVLLEHRRRERRRMVRALRSQRTTTLLADWAAFLQVLVTTPTDDRPDAERPIAAVVGRRIRKAFRRMVADGSAIDASSPHAALHELRKVGKELRYLLELFAGVYDADVVKPMVKRLKALQDTLGRFQDREVQVTMLRSLREEVAAMPTGSATLLAMGMLIERLELEQEEARAEFAERFAAFASERERKLVRKAFR